MIQMKGNGGRLCCVIPEVLPEEDITSAIDMVVSNETGIFKGAQVIIDFEGRKINADLLCLVMKRLVWPLGMSVVAWRSLDGESLDLLKRAGLPVEDPGSFGPASSKAPLPAMRIRRSLRSGQRVEHRGDVIVEGNVNDGAEVLASGNVVILGRLQGLVHAGFGGCEDASVCARVFEAPQVRIGLKVGFMDKRDSWWGKSVVVSVDDGAVVVSEWPSV